MRELSVYFCPFCGHYAYFQLVKHAVCHKCNLKMNHLDMAYSDFINLNTADRDDLLAREIIFKDPSILNRITARSRLNNARSMVGALMEQVHELETENQKLNNTIDWMHDTIWELLHKNKAMEQQLEELHAVPFAAATSENHMLSPNTAKPDTADHSIADPEHEMR